MLRNFLLLAWSLGSVSLSAQTVLRYHPAAADNPLKGLVPYDGEKGDLFPHSMEFFHLPLSDLVTGPDRFDWTALEDKLESISGRGHQAVFRVWMEYPGQNKGIPEFLEESGVTVTEWLNTNTAPFPPQKVRTPDYESPVLRRALVQFIHALGRRYDGDPRIGFITAGLLGTWGEWHTYPRIELMASQAVQTEVMDAYETAFKATHVLLRYPAGPDNPHYAANAHRRFGYHDDSFAWATLATGRPEDDWFFIPALTRAGPAALQHWKTAPIGGEIRPELWGLVFDDPVPHERAQDLDQCIRQTHATWLMDTGMFRQKQSPQRIQNALRAVRRMGYEFYVQRAAVERQEGIVAIRVNVENTGVAPFYYRWPVELVYVDSNRCVLGRRELEWHVDRLLPGQVRVWKTAIPDDRIPAGTQQLGIRIRNPMPNGLALRFANAPVRMLPDGTLLVGVLE